MVASYTVGHGDSLAGIALKKRVSVSYLLALNKKIVNPSRIYAGQKIKVPDEKAVKYLSTRSIELNDTLKQLAAVKSKQRMAAVRELIKKDWRAVPILLPALRHKDPEVRENVREVLREMHKSKHRPMKLEF